jgi:hypothetical protein
MKAPSFSALLGAAAVLAVTIAALPIEAATNLNSSRSNIYKPIQNAADEAACVKAGGTVVMQSGKKVCVVAAPATNLNSSKSN